jgi:hypothetical protein
LDIKIFKTIILLVLLCGCESVSHVTGRTEIEGVCEQGAKKSIRRLGLKRQEAGDCCVMRSFIIYTLYRSGEGG